MYNLLILNFSLDIFSILKLIVLNKEKEIKKFTDDKDYYSYEEGFIYNDENQGNNEYKGNNKDQYFGNIEKIDQNSITNDKKKSHQNLDKSIDNYFAENSKYMEVDKE